MFSMFSSRTSCKPPGVFETEGLDGRTIIPDQWRRDQNNWAPLTRIGRKSSLAEQEIMDEFCKYGVALWFVFVTTKGASIWNKSSFTGVKTHTTLVSFRIWNIITVKVSS